MIVRNMLPPWNAIPAVPAGITDRPVHFLAAISRVEVRDSGSGHLVDDWGGWSTILGRDYSYRDGMTYNIFPASTQRRTAPEILDVTPLDYAPHRQNLYDGGGTRTRERITTLAHQASALPLGHPAKSINSPPRISWWLSVRQVHHHPDGHLGGFGLHTLNLRRGSIPATRTHPVHRTSASTIQHNLVE